MQIKPSKNISWQIYDNAVYILDERSEHMRKIDKAGVYFWQIIKDAPTFDEVMLRLLEIYAVPSQDLEVSLLLFIQELQEYEIVEILE